MADTSPTPACVVPPTHELQREALPVPPAQQLRSQPPSSQASSSYHHFTSPPNPLTLTTEPTFPSSHDSAAYNDFLEMLSTSPTGYRAPQPPRQRQQSSSGWDPATAWAAQWEPIPDTSFTPTSNMDVTDWSNAFLGVPIAGPSSQNSQSTDVHMTNATLYSGSDGVPAPSASSRNTNLPAYQFDLQENVALLSSFGLISQNLKEQAHRGNASSSSSAMMLDVLGQEGQQRTQILNPGAVELGLSGESRLDSNWLAFMKDCGILGSPDPMPLP